MAATPTPTRDESERSAWSVAVVAALAMSICNADRQTLGAIATDVRRALQIDHAHYGILVSGFSLAYLTSATITGSFLDRFGARWGLTVALVLWSAVAASHALAMSFASLLVLRILLGLTEAPAVPAGMQAVRGTLAQRHRPIGYGLLNAGLALGVMVGAPVAAAINAHFGFRFAFFTTAILGTAWIPLWLAVTRGRDLTAATTGEDEPARPLSFGALVKSGPVLRAVVAFAGVSPGLTFAPGWIPQYFVETWHMPQPAAARCLILPALLYDAGAIGFGFLRSKTHSSTGLFVLSAALAASLALVPIAPSSNLALAFFGMASLGGAGVMVMATTEMLARLPHSRASSASGLTVATLSLTTMIASPIAGAVIDRTHDYTAVLLGLGFLVVPAAIAYMLWPSKLIR